MAIHSEASSVPMVNSTGSPDAESAAANQAKPAPIMSAPKRGPSPRAAATIPLPMKDQPISRTNAQAPG